MLINKKSFFLVLVVFLQGNIFGQKQSILIPFEKAKLWGYVNVNNITQIDPQYQAALLFTNNMGIVVKNEKYGVIDSNNKIIIPFVHDFIEYLGDGFFKVGDQTKYWGEYYYGVVNKENQIILEKKYSGISKKNNFFVATIQIDSIIGKISIGDIRGRNIYYGLFSLKGKMIIPVQYQNLEWVNDELIVLRKGNKQALYNSEGRALTDFKYAQTWIRFNNGLSSIRLDSKCGYINKNGREIIPPIFQICHPFYGNFSLVKERDKYKLINKNGKPIAFLKYDFVRNFFSGTAIAKTNNKWVLVDSTSKELTPPYDDIKRAYNGGIAVKKSNKWALIDNKGNLLTDFIYDEVKIIENDDLHITSFWLAPFKYDQGFLSVSQNGKWGIINKDGKLIIKTEYDAVSPFTNGISYVKKDQKRAIVDSFGSLKTNFVYDYLQSDFYGLDILNIYQVIVYGKNNLSGLITPLGEEIIPPSYNLIHPADDGYFQVVFNKKWGIIDLNGKEIIKPKYDFIKLQKTTSNHGSVFNNGVCLVLDNGKWYYVNKNGTEYKIEE